MYEGKFFESFEIVEDRREQGKVQHRLLDIVFIVVTAVIAGCNEWKEIKWWIDMEANQKWIKKYIELANGVPSLSTIGRLFNIISPKQFEKCFASWMQHVVRPADQDIVSIDGKTMRGSVDGDKKGAHIVSAMCRSHSLVIGQVKVNEKTNEIKAIPDLLDMLYIKGCIVTIDAMGCQKAIAEKIIDCKADYVLNVKGNQEGLKSDIIACFEEEVMVERMETLKQETREIKKPAGDAALSMIRTIDFGHGRIEKRTYWYTQAIDWMLDAKKDWKKLAGVGMVMRETEIGEVKTSETSYFIGSISDIKNFEKAVRNHWQIESMHWVLDVVYKDDANRTRKGTAPQNMAVLKKVALNAVKKDTRVAGKLSVKGRRFKAAHDMNYLDYIARLNFID